jgi:hypothetical protein
MVGRRAHTVYGRVSLLFVIRRSFFRQRRINMRAILAVGILVFCNAAATAQKSIIARTADGYPDLQGIWANDTVTPLERPKRFADKEVLSEQEAIAYEKDAVGRWRDSFGDVEVTTSGELEDFWQEYGKVVPSRRTSLIVDPSDGKIPALTPDAKARADAAADAMKLHPADDPEDRNLPERCITTAKPPMLPHPYNGILQIVQTPGYLMIFDEMIHDVRIVRMATAHRPHAIRQWLGDSIGRWDGDTLVVETTNFTDKTRFSGSGEDLRVVERFTRVSPDTIRYEFTIDDALSFTRPWSGTLSLTRTDSRMYEYACHEGNYGLTDILRGARATEAETRKR